MTHRCVPQHFTPPRPSCAAAERQHKAGANRGATQRHECRPCHTTLRHECRACRRTHTPEPKRYGKMYVDGVSLRRAAR